jgi:phage gp36-like protein
MAYATQADLADRFGADELAQLTDRAGAGVPDATVVARALADADAEIDAYLGTRYALPLPAVPSVIARLACDIARFRLWEDRASDEVRRRYEDARRLLDAIARGQVSLGLPAAQQPSAEGVAYAAAARTMDRTATAGYQGS